MSDKQPPFLLFITCTTTVTKEYCHDQAFCYVDAEERKIPIHRKDTHSPVLAKSLLTDAVPWKASTAAIYTC